MEERHNSKTNLFSTLLLMPNSIGHIPKVRIKSIHFQKFKTFENYFLDFNGEQGIKEFVCLIGPNGCGKSTILNAIQLIFSRIEGRELDRVKTNLGKSVRHVGKSMDGVYTDEDFLLTAQIESSVGDYEVAINKSGFIKDHPAQIKNYLYRICYSARFDQELNRFQLAREKWGIFKDLFESVTGFEVEENTDIEYFLGGTDDPSMRNLIKNYVLAFYVKKPDAIIHQKECSDGEKKIIKSFSTLLTLDYTPQIILVDNIEMHVERKRHMSLISSMKKCYPDSQIFSTTHSYYVSKALGKNGGIEDLRLVRAIPIIKAEPWRLMIIDELEDSQIKLMAFDASSNLVEEGKKLISDCYNSINDLQQFKNKVSIFLKEVSDIFVTGVMPKI